MNLDDHIKIVKEIQRLTEEQVSNREKTLKLSKELEKDVTNDKVRMDIKKLEIENISLHKRNKELISKL